MKRMMDGNETEARIRAMEQRYDALLGALKEDPLQLGQDEALGRMHRELKAYYEGGQWLKDYRMDEQGLLPACLKRGVLSEDGVYNLLDEIGQWISGDEHAQI